MHFQITTKWRPFCSHLNVETSSVKSLPITVAGVPAASISSLMAYWRRQREDWCAIVLAKFSARLIWMGPDCHTRCQWISFGDRMVYVIARCQAYNIFGKIYTRLLLYFVLTHWGRVTHVCVGSLAIISPNNGLSPGRRQDIICTNAGILWIGPLVTNFSEILIKLYIFSFKKIPLKLSSGNWRLSFGLYVQILW